ncbi:site-specific integrase, partial [Tannerella forsythia]
LTEDNIVELDGREWIMTRRQKTRVATNIILLDIPKRIIEKYAPVRKNGHLLPILSNQKMNAYLKEIADLCNIRKPLSFHMARHREFCKHQIINRLNRLSIKGGNDKETSELLYSTLFCHFKEPLCLLQR